MREGVITEKLTKILGTMKKDKHDDKVKLVEKLMGMYVKKHNKNLWNENDMFDVCCWFVGEMILKICDAQIIPIEELHERINKKLIEHVDDVFEQIQEFLSNPDNL